MNKTNVRTEIMHLLNQGVYDQNEIFRIIYPHYIGHYAKLREIIAECKHGIG